MQFFVSAIASILALAGTALAQVPQGVDPNTLPKSTLSLSLKNGRLYDGIGRTAYIADNYQFQFDDPPQAGYLIDSGFSICGGNLALRGSTTWWSCDSGDYSNLYDRKWAEQCEPVNVQVVPDVGTSTFAPNVGPMSSNAPASNTATSYTPARPTTTASPAVSRS